MNEFNEFNEKFGKNYHVGPAGLVINGIQRNMILTLEMQKNADILVLLRTGSSNLSKYAISSKVVEYLQSGTPIIANKVESLPLEFYNYINIPQRFVY